MTIFLGGASLRYEASLRFIVVGCRQKKLNSTKPAEQYLLPGCFSTSSALSSAECSLPKHFTTELMLLVKHLPQCVSVTVSSTACNKHFFGSCSRSSCFCRHHMSFTKTVTPR